MEYTLDLRSIIEVFSFRKSRNRSIIHQKIDHRRVFTEDCLLVSNELRSPLIESSTSNPDYCSLKIDNPKIGNPSTSGAKKRSQHQQSTPVGDTQMGASALFTRQADPRISRVIVEDDGFNESYVLDCRLC